MPCSSLYSSWRARRRSVSSSRVAHRLGDSVGVHDHLTVRVSRGPSDRLDQRSRRAQEAFLVRVEDAHERHFRQVEALTQEVDADENVELAPPQISKDINAIQSVHVAVKVAHANAQLAVVFGEVLGHPLGQRRDQARARCAQRARESRRAGRRPGVWSDEHAPADRASPVGRITCSTTTPLACSTSQSPGVALT